jgi:hypothetical protein
VQERKGQGGDVTELAALTIADLIEAHTVNWQRLWLGFGASQLLSPYHPRWRTLVEEVADRRRADSQLSLGTVQT